jgi:type I restriction enzyme S subunit
MPFPVPREWLWTRIRHVTQEHGQTTPASEFTYIDVSAIDKEVGRIGEPLVLAPSDAPSRARKIVKSGDVLYSCVRPYLLNVAVVDTAFDPPPIASTAFAVLDGLGLVVPRYLWTVLRSSYFVDCVEGRMRGQAYPAINDADFAVLPFPLPPLAEQERIVAKVGELMELCDQLEAAHKERAARQDRLRSASLHRLTAPATDHATSSAGVRFFLDQNPRLIAKSEHVAPVLQAILVLAVRGRLVPQDPKDEPAAELLARVKSQKKELGPGVTGREWASKSASAVDGEFGLPRGWEWSRIGTTVERVTVGYVGPMTSHYVESGIPFLRSQNVRPNRFRPEGLISISPEFHHRIRKSALTPGDVVVVRSGNVGTACVVPEQLPDANCSDLVVVKKPMALVPEFLSFYLNSLASTHVQAGTVGMALTHFNTKSVAMMPVPVPPFIEQQQIVAKVTELTALCDDVEAALAAAQDSNARLIEVLLREAMEGEVVRELVAADLG